MIEYIKGELTDLTPALAVVEAAGVGYALGISLITYSSIQGKKDVKLYVHEQLVTGGRDDGFTLFGFATKAERELYRMLITVSGIGGNTARMILSAMSAAELCNAISTGDERLLKSVKGIGPKAAQRIILELKDKISNSALADEFHIADAKTQDSQGPAINKQVRDEAVGALTTLGYSPAPSAKVVNEILKAEPDLSVEMVIKKAFKMIK